VFELLWASNIMVNLHYIPIHLQSFYENMGFLKGDYSEAKKYYSEAITLPLHPSLSFDEQDFMVNCLKKSLEL
jgi:dTDP-4-amino-4,6-dideoxygalactose transaminase